MAYLLPLVANMVYNNNVTDTTFLATINLLSIATHPTYPYVIYALYGSNNIHNFYSNLQL